MKKIKSSQRGLTLSYADFIKQVRGFALNPFPMKRCFHSFREAWGPMNLLQRLTAS